MSVTVGSPKVSSVKASGRSAFRAVLLPIRTLMSLLAAFRIRRTTG